jgi:hypothetical protein
MAYAFWRQATKSRRKVLESAGKSMRARWAMSRPPTYARKVDASTRAIDAAFKAAGCSVTPMQRPEAGLPDRLIGFLGVDHKVEYKNPSKSGRQTAASGLSEAQQAFDESWRGSRTNVAHTPAEALALVAMWRAERVLADRAAQALARDSRPGVVTVVEGGLGAGDDS